MKTNHYTNFRMRINPLLISFGILFLMASTGTYSQSIELLSPNGGENWLTGTTQTVSWTFTGTPTDIMVEYSTDGGASYTYLGYSSVYDSTSSFTFINYMTASTQAKIRVSMYSNSSVSDESDSTFTVTESPVYFYYPWAGSSYYRTSPVNISWYSSSLQVFDLDYTTDNGATWNSITTGFEGNNYEWTAADVVSDSCMIRISESGNVINYGLSPIFSIIDIPTVTLVNPNGGETWNYGEVKEVSWTGSNLPYYLYLDISLDNGQTWDYLGYAYGADTGGTTTVYVPQASSTEALVRISDPNFDQVNDVSDNVFTIYTPPVIMYYPSEGDEYFNKSTTYINWLATGIDTVNIELSTDNGQSWSTIENGLSAYYGYYYWTINATPSASCIIKVSDASDPAKFGLSGTFSILPSPVIEITSPQAGDIWNTDSTYTITWTHDNEDAWYIDLQYSLDGGQSWNYMGWANNTVPEGSFTWTTPDVESDSCMIRVFDYYYDFVADTTPMFSIKNFPATPICMVSVDTENNQNMIIWDKPVSPLIDTFIVYREGNSAAVYEPIGYVAYEDTAIFTDGSSNPTVKPYRYRLGYMDEEGNVYPYGAYHQTIHLSINKGVNNSWNLAWTDYTGFEVNTYNIYRKTDTSEFVYIESISASFNSYTDFDAPEGEVHYVVEVENPNGCNAGLKAGGFSVSRSNMVTNSSLGIDEEQQAIPHRIYPNPASDQLIVELTGEQSGNIIIEIVGAGGHVLLQEEYNTSFGNSKVTLNTASLHSGIYFLRIVSNRAYSVSKVIIQN